MKYSLFLDEEFSIGDKTIPKDFVCFVETPASINKGDTLRLKLENTRLESSRIPQKEIRLEITAVEHIVDKGSDRLKKCIQKESTKVILFAKKID